jgi:hypothetical protein
MVDISPTRRSGKSRPDAVSERGKGYAMIIALILLGLVLLAIGICLFSFKTGPGG